MFFGKKQKTREEINAEIEKMYQKKEATLDTLCGDIYNTGKSGLLTAFVGGLVFPISSAFFGVGMYSVYERIFVENSPRLSDNAGLLIMGSGLTAIVSLFGTKQLSKWTIGDYRLFKEHLQEYQERIEKSKT